MKLLNAASEFGCLNRALGRVRWASWVCGLMLCLVLTGSAQATDYKRHLDIYYGTWNVFAQGNPNPIASQTFVELTDHISSGLRFSILNSAVDARLQSPLPLWIFPPDLTNIEWVLGTPENLPAIANFNAAIAALGGTITIDSGFQSRGTQTYA